MTLEDLDFHVARTRRELESAYGLVHTSYERAGLVDAHGTGLRFGPHNFLPDTRTFVATLHGDVVATVTLVFDSPLGLPMDAVYGDVLGPLRADGRRLVEVTMLADRRASGRRTLPIVLRLTKILFDYAREQAESDDLVVAVHPRHQAFYERLLYFEAIGERRSYVSVRGNPAVALRLDLIDVAERCRDDARVQRLYFSQPTPAETFADPLRLTD